MASEATDDYLSFDEFLKHWGTVAPDRIALEMDGRITTYGEAEKLTRQLVAFFAENGVGRGDRIAWLGKNSDRYFLLLYAAARVGAVMAPVGWRLAPPEAAYILTDTGSKLLFVEDGFIDTASEVTGTLENPPRVFEVEAAFDT